MVKITGLTKTAGWEMGVRRTFPVTAEDAWKFLLSPSGIALWLGKVNGMHWEKGHAYKTSTGTEGEIRVVKEQSHLRLTWKKKNWENGSLLQVRVIKGKEKSTISFHQERLSSALQRKEMLEHWNDIINKLEKKLR